MRKANRNLATSPALQARKPSCRVVCIRECDGRACRRRQRGPFELLDTMVTMLGCPCQTLTPCDPGRQNLFGHGKQHLPTLFRCKSRLGKGTAVSSLQSPKGFGPVKNQQPVVKKSPAEIEPLRQQQKSTEEDDDDVIPEAVTNRMMKRIGLTVGVPLIVGVLGFPLYYYLKVVQKVDVPEWLPLLTSMATFGFAGFGISYGILSTSWDPLREGSLLGWQEAKANWPVFWDNVSGKDRNK